MSPAIIPSAPPVEAVAAVIVAYIAGCVTPYWYMQERLRGFGRWMASRIPYQPPPGEDAGEALQAAVDAGEESPDVDSKS